MATTTVLQSDPSVDGGDEAIDGNNNSIGARLGARMRAWRLDHELYGRGGERDLKLAVRRARASLHLGGGA